jgi:hypothetical protein
MNKIAFLLIIMLVANIATTNGAWNQKASMPSSSRYMATSFSIESKGYVGLGEDSVGHYLNDWWQYNLSVMSKTPEVNKEIAIEIFPTIVHEYLNIYSEEYNKIKFISITSENPAKIRTVKRLTQSHTILNMDDFMLSDGIYFITFFDNSNKNIKTLKFIIQK